MSRRTATVKYYASNGYGKMVHTRTHRTEIPIDAGLMHLKMPDYHQNGIMDKILWICLYFMVFIGFITCIFGAFNGSIFSPTQFIMFIQEKCQTFINMYYKSS